MTCLLHGIRKRLNVLSKTTSTIKLHSEYQSRKLFQSLTDSLPDQSHNTLSFGLISSSKRVNKIKWMSFSRCKAHPLINNGYLNYKKCCLYILIHFLRMTSIFLIFILSFLRWGRGGRWEGLLPLNFCWHLFFISSVNKTSLVNQKIKSNF